MLHDFIFVSPFSLWTMRCQFLCILNFYRNKLTFSNPGPFQKYRISDLLKEIVKIADILLRIMNPLKIL